MAIPDVEVGSNKPERTVERNVALLGDLMRFLLEEPQVLAALPDNFELVILPDDDAELRLYNLELLDQHGSEGKPVVFVRMPSVEEAGRTEIRPSLYVPLAT